MKNAEESKLIRRLKKGNQQAFHSLYHQYANDAIRTVHAITRNENDTLDIVQEAFIKVYRHIDRFDVNKPFKPWLYRILINETMRYLKREKQTSVPLTEEMLDYLNEKQQVFADDRLEIALESLDPELRALLVLKYFHAYQESEIANLLNIPVSTVKSRLYKARNMLRSSLGGVADEE